MPEQKGSTNHHPVQEPLSVTERMEIYSAEMQEIIGRVPNWLISYGITLIFVVITILLIGSWFFTYPDVISTITTLTTENPPVEVIANGNGKLQHLLVEDGQKVVEGEYLGVLENTAVLSHVLELKKNLPRFREFLENFESKKIVDLERPLTVGELQSSCDIFLKNYNDCLHFSAFSPKNGRTKNKLRAKLKLSFNDLLEALAGWEAKYILQSPMSGTVVFKSFWRSNQNVTAGDKIFIVNPEKTGEWIAQLLLPVQGAGKVKIGQKVRIKLDDYSFMEFGVIWGKICSRSLLPVDDNYLVKVYFPWGLKTTQGRVLELHHGIRGRADIIIEKKSLLERILSPVKSLLKRNFEGT